MRSPFAATLAIAVLTAAAYAAKPAPQSPISNLQSEAPNSSANIYARLGKAKNLFYSGKPEEALALLEDLANSDKFQIRMEARFLAGRCLWLSDNEKDQKQAQKIWDQFAKEIVDWKPGPVRIAIAKSLVLESAGDETQAIRTLEAAVGRNVRNVATPEAQIELAKLLARNGRVEEAKQQLASAEDLLNRETKVEMHKDEAAPYYAAIKVTRDNLKYDANPGLAEVEQADRLRAEKKFAEAGKLYEQIIGQWPKSESADRATVGMGHCLLAIGKSGPAADLWRKFIAAAPAARWRGQATTALLDMGLEGQLTWEETRKLAAWAETTLPAALAGEKAESENRKAETGGTSWQQAAYPLNLQIAAIHWISGQYEPAGAALDQCIKLSEGDRAKRLSSLAEVVRAKKSLLPSGADFSRPSPDGKPAQLDPASVVLSMSVIRGLADQHESAARLAGLVAVGKLSATPPQKSFARFVVAAIDEATGKADTAKAGYQELAKTAANQPWTDEVYYRLAAFADVPKDVPPAVAEPSSGQKPQRPAVQVAAPAPEVVAELYRRVAGVQGTPRVERSLWRLGVHLTRLGEVEEAERTLRFLADGYPKGPYTADALVRLIDLAIEYRFDVNWAEKNAKSALAWVASADDAKPSAAAQLPPWRILGHTDPEEKRTTVYDIYVRAGLAAYLRQDTPGAVSLFRKANELDPAAQEPKHNETSMERMISVVQGEKNQLAPADLLAMLKDDRQRTALVLADLYLMSFQPQKAGDLYQRLMDGDAPFPKPSTGVEAYLLLRRSQSLEFQRQHEAAMATLKKLHDPKYARFPWTADGISRLGTWGYNATDDDRAAMEQWEVVFTKYPNHPEAERSLFFYCLSAIDTKQWKKAEAACNEYLRRYPNSRWTERVKTDLLKQVQAGFKKERER